MEKSSPAMDLVSIVAEHRENGRKISNIKFQHYMQDALTSAIKAGLRFDIQDFRALDESCLTFYKWGIADRDMGRHFIQWQHRQTT